MLKEKEAENIAKTEAQVESLIAKEASLREEMDKNDITSLDIRHLVRDQLMVMMRSQSFLRVRLKKVF